jgi:hypothetical protein
LTRAEYARGIAQLRFRARRSRKNRPLSIKLINFVGASAFVVLFVLAANAFTPTSAAAVWTFALVFAAYAAFAVWVSRSGITLRASPLDDGSILRPYTFTVLEDGLLVESDVSSGHFTWRAIKTIEHHAGLILIFLDRSNAYILPHRIFPDPSTAERLVEHLNQRIAATSER